MIEVFDRVPTLPGRVKLTREDGTEEYVTWERADDPTEVGTPINKALFDSIKEDIEARIPLSGGTATGNIIVTSDTAARSFGCKVGSYDIRFMANTNGNRGLYDNVTGDWLLKKDQYNDLVLYGFAKTVSSDAIKRATTAVTTSEIAKGGYLSSQSVKATTVTGYTPFAVIAVQSNSSYTLPYMYFLNESSGSIGYSIRNLNASASITPTLTFHVLYRRSTIAAQ